MVIMLLRRKGAAVSCPTCPTSFQRLPRGFEELHGFWINSFKEVWDNYTNEDLELMQRRGKQLSEGGYGAVDWNNLTGRR